jgi:hypothetical protein
MRVPTWIAPLLLAACSATIAGPTQKAVHAAPVEVQPAAAKHASTRQPTPTPQAAPIATEVHRDTHYPPGDAVDVVAWLRAHGVTTALREQPCWDVGERVGVPPRPGLLCLATTHRPERTVATLHRLDGPRLSAVWQGVVGTYANWLELTPVLAPDGARLDLHERGANDCENALSELVAKSYVFRDGAYVRHLR